MWIVERIAERTRDLQNKTEFRISQNRNPKWVVEKMAEIISKFRADNFERNYKIFEKI